jgi:hypothetical protein
MSLPTSDCHELKSDFKDMTRLSSKFLDSLFERALDTLLSQDANTLLSGVSERSSCGRLAVHLEVEMQASKLSGYYAEVEYNRKQNGQVKTMIDEDMQIISITPDVIVHSRGESVRHDNLIAVEMKKTERPEAEKDSDRLRLKIMTRRSFNGIWSADGVTHPEHVCGYRVGIFIEIDRLNRRLVLEYFKAGVLTKTRVKTF